MSEAGADVLASAPAIACILGIGVAWGDQQHTQQALLEAYLGGRPFLTIDDVEWLQAQFLESGIEKRGFMTPIDALVTPPTLAGTSDLLKRMDADLVKLQTAAAEAALSNWGGDRSTITHLVYGCSSRGSAPSLDIDLILSSGTLKLPPTVQRISTDHQGALSSARLLGLAATIAKADDSRRVLVVDGNLLWGILFRAVTESLRAAGASAGPTDLTALRLRPLMALEATACDGAGAAVVAAMPSESGGEAAVLELVAHASDVPPLESPKITDSDHGLSNHGLGALVTAVRALGAVMAHSGSTDDAVPWASSPDIEWLVPPESAPCIAAAADRLGLMTGPAATAASHGLCRSRGCPPGGAAMALLAAFAAEGDTGRPYAIVAAADAATGAEAIAVRRPSASRPRPSPQLGPSPPAEIASTLRDLLTEQLLLETWGDAEEATPLSDLGVDSFMWSVILTKITGGTSTFAAAGTPGAEPPPWAAHLDASDSLAGLLAKMGAAAPTPPAVAAPCPAPAHALPAILGLASAFPPPERTYAQSDLAEALISQRTLTGDAAAFARECFRGTGVARRGLSLPLAQLYSPVPPGGAAELTASTAAALGDMQARAAEAAIAQWGGAAGAVTHLVYGDVSSRGQPAAIAALVSRLGLSRSIKVTVVDHMGCLGGFRLLALAGEMAAADATHRVLLVYGDLSCGLGLALPDTPSLHDIMGLALFADGAAAAVVGTALGAERPQALLAGHASRLLPNSKEDMYMAHKINAAATDPASALVVENFVSSRVPVFVGKHVAGFAESLRATAAAARRGAGATVGDCAWLVHPGGKTILEAVQKKLGAARHQLQWSWEVMAAHGNISGATNLMVLDAYLARSDPDTRYTAAIAMSFGPGLGFEGIALLPPMEPQQSMPESVIHPVMQPPSQKSPVTLPAATLPERAAAPAEAPALDSPPASSPTPVAAPPPSPDRHALRKPPPSPPPVVAAPPPPKSCQPPGFGGFGGFGSFGGGSDLGYPAAVAAAHSPHPAPYPWPPIGPYPPPYYAPYAPPYGPPQFPPYPPPQMWPGAHHDVTHGYGHPLAPPMSHGYGHHPYGGSGGPVYGPSPYASYGPGYYGPGYSPPPAPPSAPPPAPLPPGPPDPPFPLPIPLPIPPSPGAATGGFGPPGRSPMTPHTFPPPYPPASPSPPASPPPNPLKSPPAAMTPASVLGPITPPRPPPSHVHISAAGTPALRRVLADAHLGGMLPALLRIGVQDIPALGRLTEADLTAARVPAVKARQLLRIAEGAAAGEKKGEAR